MGSNTKTIQIDLKENYSSIRLNLVPFLTQYVGGIKLSRPPPVSGFSVLRPDILLTYVVGSINRYHISVTMHEVQ